MNIILLISDTFRYDNLFKRARMPVRTPNLDAFASRAASLERLYVSSFPTIPHRTDLTSGRYGWPWYGWQHLKRGTRNHAPEILARAGYVSQLLCDCPHLFPNGFNQGFSAARAIRGQEGDIHFLKMNRPIDRSMPAHKTRTGRHFMGRNLPDLSRWINADWAGEDDRFPARTSAQTVRWLEENYRHHPFFLWVDFFDPHEPWDVPEYMLERYDPGYRGAPMIHPNYGKASDLTARELKNLRAHYCAEAELVDRAMGRILQKIDDLGLWRNSIVVFTTDHGMSLGEHNRTGKSNINEKDGRRWPLYPEIAHIPFMIAAPGIMSGRKIRDLLQPPDILPTLLELASVRADPPEPFHGVSFAPLLHGRKPKVSRDYLISASFLRGEGKKQVTPVIYGRRFAYAPIGPEGRSELFDLSRDPYAERNVIRKHPKEAANMHHRILDWLENMQVPSEAIQPFIR